MANRMASTSTRDRLRSEPDLNHQIINAERALSAGKGHCTTAQRKDAVDCLLTIARSPHSRLKLLASKHLAYFYEKAFDQREDIHDAVYDLCEDADVNIRIAGYKAVLDISRAVESCRRRNTDVLVQLLQSTDPKEVEIIRQCLSQHVRLDAATAISVLIEHCITPLNRPGDAQGRGDLMGLVVDFLTKGWSEQDQMSFSSGTLPQYDWSKWDSEGGRGAVLEVVWSPQQQGQAETLLRDGLLKAFECATKEERTAIVRNILLCLPSYNTPFSSHLESLLDNVVQKMTDAIRRDVTQSPCTLSETGEYFDLAVPLFGQASATLPYRHRTVLESSTVPRSNPVFLLKSINTWLLPHNIWARCTADARVAVLRMMGLCVRAIQNMIAASSQEPFKAVLSQNIVFQAVAVRDKTINMCTAWLQGWLDSPDFVVDKSLRRAVIEILLAMKHRVQKSQWMPDTNLHALLVRMQKQVNIQLTTPHPEAFFSLGRELEALFQLYAISTPAPSKPLPPSHQPQSYHPPQSISNRSISSPDVLMANNGPQPSRKRRAEDYHDHGNEDVQSGGPLNKRVKREPSSLLTRMSQGGNGNAGPSKLPSSQAPSLPPPPPQQQKPPNVVSGSQNPTPVTVTAPKPAVPELKILGAAKQKSNSGSPAQSNAPALRRTQSLSTNHSTAINLNKPNTTSTAMVVDLTSINTRSLVERINSGDIFSRIDSGQAGPVGSAGQNKRRRQTGQGQ